MHPYLTVVCGEDDFSVEEYHLGWMQADVFTEIREGAVSLQDIAQVVESESLFSTQTQLMIKQPHFLTQALDDKAYSHFQHVIHMASKGPHRVLIVHKGKLDQRKKTTQLLKKQAFFVEYELIKEWEHDKLVSWIQTRIQKMGKDSTPEACQQLHLWGGNNLRILAAQINTLIAYVGQKSCIEPSDVKAVTSSGEVSVFDLLESLKFAKRDRLIQEGKQLLHQGEDPVKLLGLITATMRLYTVILLGKARGKSAEELAKDLKRHPFYISKLAADIQKKYTLDRMKHIYRCMAWADLSIKKGLSAPRYAMETLFLEGWME